MSVMPQSSGAASPWGPLSQPIHGSVPDGSPPWRDNAFLAFWDPAEATFGALHVSTSPNAEGRRARVTVHHQDQFLQVVEPLAPGTFTSASITFDVGSTFAVRGDEFSAELTFEPRFSLADYTGDRTPKGFGVDEERAPLQHYQHAARVTGWLEVDGRRVELDGAGIRDRTWGFRDESVNLAETIGFFWTFPAFAISAMRLRGIDDTDTTLGFVMTEEEAVPIRSFSVTRDAMGLFVGTTIDVEGRDPITVRAERQGGHFSPMGWERTGPTHSAYDEFSVLRTEAGEEGFGMVEQGVVRRIF